MPALLLAALVLSSSWSPAVANSIPDDALLQSSKADRTVYIGEQHSPSLALNEGRTLSIGRAGDLVGTPVTLIKAVVRRTPSATGRNNAVAAGLDLLIAARNTRLTSTFGARRDPFGGGWRAHSGVDLAASHGTPVYASGSGTVATARWQGGYGLLISLDHGGGIQTRYGHLSGLSVNEGQRVNKGDLIGFVGSTGRSTGPHLHYEVRENGLAVDPLRTGRR